MGKNRYEEGMRIRRKILGDAHVDRAEAGKTEVDRDFQRYITENAWGSVWTRDGLSHRERSMLTISTLAVLGHHGELAMHIRAAKNAGTQRSDIIEVLLQVAVYAGVPAANAAFAIAKKTFEALDSAEAEET